MSRTLAFGLLGTHAGVRASSVHADGGIGLAIRPVDTVFAVNQTLAKTQSALLTANDKVFCIGPNKADTSSYHDLFASFPNDFQPCHDECDPNGGSELCKYGSDGFAVSSCISWTHAIRSDKQIDAPVIKNHRAFMDNGDFIDFKWVDVRMPRARYVLNTRGLKAWLLSRYDHVAQFRILNGCTAQGGPDTCPKVSFYNTEEKMTEWILYSAWHQQEALAYFNADDEARQRFVVIDLESYSHDTVPMLMWAARADLSKNRVTQGVVDEPVKLPASWRGAVHELASQLKVPEANVHANSKGGHSESTIQYIEGFLQRKCPNTLTTDKYYTKCALQIEPDKSKWPTSTSGIGKLRQGTKKGGSL